MPACVLAAGGARSDPPVKIQQTVSYNAPVVEEAAFVDNVPVVGVEHGRAVVRVAPRDRLLARRVVVHLYNW